MDNRKFKKHPTAYLVPRLVNISLKEKIHFTFDPSVEMNTEKYESLKKEYIEKFNGTILWDIQYLIDSAESILVIDKFGVKHRAKALYELED
jgi:hypothetical protein